MSERSRTQVILAIIGLIGIVVPVLIANWSTLFRQGGSQPVAPPNNPGIQTIPDGSKVPLPNPTGYVILFGSYNNLGSAKTDITQAKDKGFGGGIVLFKYGVYRPALVFSTEELANAKLSDAQSTLNSKAYVRPLYAWCPNPDNNSNGYLVCPNNGIF